MVFCEYGEAVLHYHPAFFIAATVAGAQMAIALVLNHEDRQYVNKLAPAFKGHDVKVFIGNIVTLYDFLQELAKFNITSVVTTQEQLLKKLLPAGRNVNAKISKYAGSIIPHGNVEFLIIDQLKALYTRPYGDFLARRYISKILKPQSWRKESNFSWRIINTGKEFIAAKEWLQNCDIIGVDTETIKGDAEGGPTIKCSGYCGLQLDKNVSIAFVVPLKTMENLQWIRELNKIKVPKVFQNGKYDIAYFARYNAPCWGYYFDTANMLHAWYSELPKNLASVSSLLMRNSMYWKDLADTQDEIEYFKYNALDTWATVESAVSWLAEAPDWAINNYKMKFPLVMPSHMCEMRGIKRNTEMVKTIFDESTKRQNELLDNIVRATGYPTFNPSSPKQVLKLLHLLGYKQAKSSDEATLEEAKMRSPLLEYFANIILEYRKERKISSTYLVAGSDFKGRLLFSLNPHGTDTGRNSSAEHHFWCGFNIQNIPRAESANGSAANIKKTFVADEGFEFWEADYSQAEDRGVAYKSGDKNLLDIFATGKDSHSYKAAMFFGIPYEEIYDSSTSTVLNKTIRQLAKVINHGANYNMGPQVLLGVMGSKKVRNAQKLLGLKSSLSPLDVCKHLLFLYTSAFPTVKSRYYTAIRNEIKLTNRLAGDAVDTRCIRGWTRYCFSEPSINAYIAHITQSLNAMILDRAFLNVFNSLAFLPDFKLITQIHDSILFQVRIGREDLAQEVKRLMTFPVDIRDCSGKLRVMIIPVELKKLGASWHTA